MPTPEGRLLDPLDDPIFREIFADPRRTAAEAEAARKQLATNWLKTGTSGISAVRSKRPPGAHVEALEHAQEVRRLAMR
jgi:hypothetical protein